MLVHRRELTWLWRAWAAALTVAALGSLLIGYLRSQAGPDLFAIRDGSEALVGLSLAAMATLPLVIAASHLYQRAEPGAIDGQLRLQRWLALALLALVYPCGFCAFFYYLFGPLGMAMRGFTTSLF